MPDDDLELVYLTLEDALELFSAIVGGTTEQAAAVLRSRSALEGALTRPATADTRVYGGLLVFRRFLLLRGFRARGFPTVRASRLVARW